MLESAVLAKDSPRRLAARGPTAVISDIHAVLPALEAVLEDIDQHGIDRIVCLGDIVGYGPNPRECLDLVMQRCAWSLLGNHDFAVLYEPTSFNASAEASAFWTRRQLEDEADGRQREGRWKYLGELKVSRLEDDILWVHGSPRRPINEYVFPDDTTTAPRR